MYPHGIPVPDQAETDPEVRHFPDGRGRMHHDRTREHAGVDLEHRPGDESSRRRYQGGSIHRITFATVDQRERLGFPRRKKGRGSSHLKPRRR